MVPDFNYQKSRKYDDLKLIYSQCSGPGGLKLAEFMAEKMGIASGSFLLDGHAKCCQFSAILFSVCP